MSSAAILNVGRARAQKVQTIQIPMLLSLSGPAAAVGNEARIGAQITADMINKTGGIAGRQLEILFVDDRSRPNDMLAAARETIASGHNLLTGGFLSAGLLAVLPLLNETRTVHVACGGLGLEFTRESFSRFFFPGVDNNYMRARAMAKLALEKFPDVLNWGAIITDSAAYTQAYRYFQAFVTEALAQKGLKANFQEPVLAKLGTTDFHTQIYQLAGLPIQGLWSLVVGEDGITLWQQARPFDFKNKFKVVIDQSIDFPEAKALKRNLPANLWELQTWYYGLHQDSPEQREFYEEYVRRTGSRYPSGRVQYGNQPIAALASALKQTNGATDSETVIRALEDLPIETVKGTFHFRKEDHLAIGFIDFINILGADEDPGFTVTDSFKIEGREIAYPADPGKPLKL